MVARPVPPMWSRAGLWLLVKRTALEFWKDRVLGLSAEAAFWQLLSLPALLLALMGTIGYFGAQLGAGNVVEVESTILRAASRLVAPTAVAQLVQPAVHAVLTTGRADVVSVGFVIALWTGSSSMATYVNTITIAYDLRDVRGAVRSRLLALWLYLGAVAIGVVVLPAAVLGPGAIVHLAPASVRDTVQHLVMAAYWPVVVSGSLVALMSLYHLAVPVRVPWRRGLPGSVLALAIWLLGSFGLRVYVSFLAGAESVYRPLSAPLAILLFFYVTGLAVLIGAELNAEIDKLWPSPESAKVRPVPPGNSGASRLRSAYRTADRDTPEAARAAAGRGEDR